MDKPNDSQIAFKFMAMVRKLRHCHVNRIYCKFCGASPMAVTCNSNGLASPKRAKVGRYSIDVTMPLGVRVRVARIDRQWSEIQGFLWLTEFMGRTGSEARIWPSAHA